MCTILIKVPPYWKIMIRRIIAHPLLLVSWSKAGPIARMNPVGLRSRHWSSGAMAESIPQLRTWNTFAAQCDARNPQFQAPMDTFFTCSICGFITIAAPHVRVPFRMSLGDLLLFYYFRCSHEETPFTPDEAWPWVPNRIGRDEWDGGCSNQDRLFWADIFGCKLGAPRCHTSDVLILKERPICFWLHMFGYPNHEDGFPKPEKRACMDSILKFHV